MTFKKRYLSPLFFSHYALASSVSLGTSSSPFLSMFANFFQQIVDFTGSTGALFVIFLALMAGLGMWVFMPKNAGVAMGVMFRACLGGIGAFAIGTFIAWLKTLAGS